MPRIDPFDIYADYSDGYCDPLAKVTQPHLKHANGSVTFARLPLYPEYEMVFDQALDSTAGDNTIAYAPVAQELLVKLSWPKMPQANKISLENFFANTVQGMSESFTYTNNFVGVPLPVRFASPSLPIMPEVGFEQYRVSLTLRVALNFPQIAADIGAPAPNLTGNRFIIGGVAVNLPAPIRGGSGSGVNKRQSAGRDSSGSQVIYDQSRILRQPHRLSMVHTYADFITLQSFFFTFVHGCAELFTWIDHNEVTRFVRLATPSISIKQLAFDRFESEINLLEEVTA